MQNGPQQGVISLCSSDLDEQAAPRKRRRTSQDERKDVGQTKAAAASTSAGAPASVPVHETHDDSSNQPNDVLSIPDSDPAGSTGAAALPPTDETYRARRLNSPRVVVSPPPAPSRMQASRPIPDAEKTVGLIEEMPRTPPKKLLKLNANGKFGSPVSKASSIDQTPVKDGRRRGRPRQAKEHAIERTLMVKLSYGSDARSRQEIGHKIAAIWAGDINVAPKQISPRKARKPAAPPKSTHPFFTGKAKPQPQNANVPKHQSPRKASAVTPGKLRTQTFGNSIHDTNEEINTYTSALLRDRLMVKHPGAREPRWPTREESHARGIEIANIHGRDLVSDAKHSRTQRRDQRKLKNVRLPLPPDESLLKHFTSELKPEEDRELRLDGFYEPPRSVRVPQRQLTTGLEIQQAVGKRLNATVLDALEDELSAPTGQDDIVHPAIRKVYDAIPTTLTPFDQGRGETQAWTQKYAPSCAAEVLQIGKEMTALRDWLKALTVSSVEGAARDVKTLGKTEVRPKKKRRRRAEELDDFLVSDDEDLHEMDELNNPDDVAPTEHGEKDQKRSVIRASHQLGDGTTKLANGVLLSGPHGCCKTAAAYAVAKELDFKVFEIFSGERRSGKDVLDKVGDMTENHLVKHHGIDASDLSAAEEPLRITEAFQRDLESGRQGKMNSFFKPKMTDNKTSPKNKKKIAAKAKVLEQVQQAVRKPPKDQQQSLILLEEVDILFKDDKEFWTTVLKLVSTSRRPFIMTCNDEDLVPLQAMALHAILRFSPTSIDLATDYLLLVAASEGHVLERQAICALLHSKDGDLRASIAELDFWCQMGIGDPRGGLSWIYQRWPPGKDVDQNGRLLRVTSIGTYQAGMGALLAGRTGEDELLQGWLEGETDWTDVGKINLTSGAMVQANTADFAKPTADRLHQLKRYASLADAMSAIDSFTCAGDQGLDPMDTTCPPMSDKQRSQSIEGLPLLEATHVHEYDHLSAKLAISMSSLACRVLPLENPRKTILARPERRTLDRVDFACFDAISVPSDNALSSWSSLQLSVFDGPLGPIATDLAPYVRSIVQYDLTLEEQRERLDRLLSEADGSRRAKRVRTTRASRSALEGSQRASTRRDRWFTKQLDLAAVLATGGAEWPKTKLQEPSARDIMEDTSTAASTPGEEGRA